MDVASERARRKNRSSTNINHLSLAPLTSKLPLKDHDALPDSSHSYIEGRSAPTTPRFLGAAPATPRSRSRSHHRTPSAPSDMTKSKSSTQLSNTKKPRSGTATPRRRKDQHVHHHGGDSDWILRTGAMVSSEAREFKGQAWLVSRQSSTSLSGQRGGEDPFEQELAREREMSRRGSAAFIEDDAAVAVASNASSRTPSRFQSRSQSIVDTRSAIMTPMDRNGDSYFPVDSISGPDFVNLDEKLEQLEKDSEQDDEAAIRQLVREGQAGKRSWLGNMMGLSLFAVDENDESDSDAESLDEELREAARGARTPRHVEGITMLPVETIPAPAKAEGGWNDATWLLSVATKVLF